MEMKRKGALNVVSHVETFLLNWGLLLLILFGATSNVTAANEEINTLVKVVYKLSVRNDSLVSREQVICVDAIKSDSVIKEPLCPSGFGHAKKRMVYIKPQYPPGVLRIPRRVVMSADNRFSTIQKCMNYSCSGNNDPNSSNSDDDDDDDDGYMYVVGLNVASPCCTSQPATFTIIPSTLKMVQSSGIAVGRPDFTLSLSCAIQQVSLGQMTPTPLGPHFPVKLYFCDGVISTIVSEISGRTLLTVLTAVISTNTAVSRVLLPREVLRAISGWIGDGSTESRSASSLHDTNACVFVEGPEEYMLCEIPPGLQNNIPTLNIEVQGCSNRLRPKAYSWAKLFSVDLNKMVDKDGFLRIWSSGSVSEAFQRGAQDWEIPRVVVGALFLHDAKITVTRNLLGVIPARGLPVLLLEAEKPSASGEWVQVGDPEERGCGMTKTCTGREVLFTSLNRCGMSPDCANVIAYHYDGKELQCRLNVGVVASLSVLSVLVIASDVVVLLLQWHVEKMTHAATSEMMRGKQK